MTSFERGETVEWDTWTAEVVASSGDEVWVKRLNGSRDNYIVPASRLRKLPPPFAVADGQVVWIGEVGVTMNDATQAKATVECINASFAARLEAEKAGAK